MHPRAMQEMLPLISLCPFVIPACLSCSFPLLYASSSYSWTLKQKSNSSWKWIQKYTYSGAKSCSCITWVGANPCQLFECRASRAEFLARYGRKISDTAWKLKSSLTLVLVLGYPFSSWSFKRKFGKGTLDEKWPSASCDKQGLCYVRLLLGLKCQLTTA